MLTYQNPIIPGFHPDPSICRVGEDFYLVTSSFEYFPGVPIYHSKDLIHWERIGYCLTRKSQLFLEGTRSSGGVWAPTLRYHEGTFYMTTTNHADKGNFYVTATDPAGEWSEPIWVDQGGIDPSLFFDEDGRVYYTSTGRVGDQRGIVQSEIDIKTGKRISDIQFLWTGSGGQCPEGPHVYKINGMYYLMIAEGGTEYGHMVTIARSESVWGPFESCPSNPILTHRNRKGHPIQGVGHADLVQDSQGEYWLVCLGFRYTRKYFHHLGRETFLLPVKFSKEGWPVVNNNQGVELEMYVEREHKIIPLEKEVSLDDFSGEKLQSYWNFLRNSAEACWFVRADGEGLKIKGLKATLSNVDPVAFIGRRQEEFDCLARTEVVFNPFNENEEAGMTIYLSDEHHYDFYICKKENKKMLQLRRVVGDINYIAFCEVLEKEEPIILEIKADALEYYFSYGYNKDQMKKLGQARTQFVSTEAGILGFVGVYLGLYATGNGKISQEEACFKWFDYRN